MTKISRILFSLTAVTLLLSTFIGSSGCANIIPPSGGERDSLPPVLRSASPPDSSNNFDRTRMVFEFDEYVDLENYLQEMIVSPMPTTMPTVNRKLQTVTVRLRDSLEANTTYTINFGKSIKDVNEGNILNNFTYVFSTGDYFDSLRVRGNVTLAQTGGIDSTLTVMLHRNPADSAVKTQRPRYVTKTDRNGNFEFRNLPPGRYFVYALQDETGSYLYLNTEKLFAFSDSALLVRADTTPNVKLLAYSITKPVAPQRAATTGGRNRPVDKRLKFSTNLRADQQDLLDSLVMTFEVPLTNFESSKAVLTKDSTYSPVADATWSLDTTRKVLTLLHRWSENANYSLILQKDFATDTLGQQLLKTDTLNFITNKLSDYGKLSIRFRNLDLTRNPVLQFVQGEDVVRSYPLSSVNFTESMFKPGEYNLRILFDDNKNGRWDPGEFFGKKRQPEIVKPILREINVKANWENQFEIDINATAAAPPANAPRRQSSAPQQNNPEPGRRLSNPVKVKPNL